MKNVYFILRTFIVLFGHVEKTPWLENKLNFKIYNVTTWLTNNYNIHIPQYLTN